MSDIPMCCNHLEGVVKIVLFTFLSFFINPPLPHQCWSGYSFKAGRRVVPSSINGRACRPSRSEFFVVFSEKRANTGWDHLKRPPRRVFPLQALVPQADDWTESYNQSTYPHSIFSHKLNLNVCLALR